MRVVVIGGGIAGLAAAWGAVRSGLRSVHLLEREDQLGTHSTGRNAAIYRPIETELSTAKLAARSADLLDELCGSRAAWLRQDGLLLVASREEPIAKLARAAEELGAPHEVLSHGELERRAAVLEGGHARAGLASPTGGVLDLHAITSALERAVRSAGVTVQLGQAAQRVVVRKGRAVGVELAQGGALDADAVVIAGGAWAAELGDTAGARLPLVPVRRHLVVLEPDTPLPPTAPTVWDAELEAYFRPESGGVLASPGDAAPWRAELPPADPRALELLWEKLAQLAPSLARARVRRSWACLRTFAPDRRSVVGADPRVAGLFWLAGLGGHGMSAGVAAGELLGACLASAPHPLAQALSPARLT